MMTRPLPLLLLALLFLAVRPSTAGAEAGLPGTRWTLVQLVRDGVSQPLVDSPDTTLDFGPDGRVEGRAAVNAYQGTYKVSPAGGLSWPAPFRVTRKGGPADHMRFENTYLNALRAVTRWEFGPDAGPELRLSTKDERTILVFRPRETAER